MALSEIDRSLLTRCLERKPGAWEDFVDRFMGLVIHVINHSSHIRSIRLDDADRDDLCAEVFLAFIRDDFAVLRHFRGKSSLATYLTVVARRIVVRQLLKRKTTARLDEHSASAAASANVTDGGTHGDTVEQRISDREQVQRLLDSLEGEQAEVVRLFHLEGKSYREISSATGIPENSVGPVLSRARQKLRAGAEASS